MGIDHRCFATFVLLMLVIAGAVVGASVQKDEKDATHQNVTTNNKMLVKIHACDTFDFIYKSTYFHECATVVVPEVYDNISYAGTIPKCMILYGVTERICNHNSRKLNHDLAYKDIALPKTAAEADEILKKLEPKLDGKKDVSDVLCKNITLLMNRLKNMGEVKDSDPYEKNYGNKILSNPDECQETCHGYDGVNKLCMVLAWANHLMETIQTWQAEKAKGNSSSAKNANATTVAATAGETAQVTIASTKTKNFPDIVKEEKPEAEVKKSKDNAGALPVVPQNQPAGKLDSPAMQGQLGNPDMNKYHADEEGSDGDINNQDIQKKISDLEPAAVAGNDGQNQQNSQLSIPSKAESKTSGIIEKPNQLGDGGPASEERQYPEMLSEQDEFSNVRPQESLKEYPTMSNEDAESHSFAYFSLFSMCCLAMYIGYHNKQKILAMVLEGRRGRRGRGSRRRPSTANYRKLDSNLEEAVTSQCNSNVTHVIY